METIYDIKTRDRRVTVVEDEDEKGLYCEIITMDKNGNELKRERLYKDEVENIYNKKNDND